MRALETLMLSAMLLVAFDARATDAAGPSPMASPPPPLPPPTSAPESAAPLAPLPSLPPVAPVASQSARAQVAPGFHPDRTLAVIGATTFGIGYVPAFASALPSTGGAVGRFFWAVFTVGLGPWLTCGEGGSSPNSYWCKGQHGSVQLLLPVAGPLLFADNHPQDTLLNAHGRELAPLAKTALFASSATQTAGLSILVASVALGESVSPEGARDRRRSVAYAGGILFSVSYAGAFISSVPSLLDWLGTDCRRQIPCPHFGGAALALPIAGPLLLIANSPRDEILAPHGAYSDTTRALLIADAAAQIAGAALLGVGLLTSGSPTSTAKEATPKLHFAPMLGGGALGLIATVE